MVCVIINPEDTLVGLKQSRIVSLLNIMWNKYIASNNLSDLDLQTLVKSTFEPPDHFKQLDVSTISRHYLRSRYDSDAGRGIHEEPCTCPTSP